MVVSAWQPTQRNMPERLDSENMSLNSPWNSLRESHLTTPSRSTGSPRMFLHKPASPSMLCRAVLARLPFSGPVSTKISSVLIIVVVFNTLAWHRGFPHVVWHNKHGSLKSSTQICHHPMFCVWLATCPQPRSSPTNIQVSDDQRPRNPKVAPQQRKTALALSKPIGLKLNNMFAGDTELFHHLLCSALKLHLQAGDHLAGHLFSDVGHALFVVLCCHDDQLLSLGCNLSSHLPLSRQTRIW